MSRLAGVLMRQAMKKVPGGDDPRWSEERLRGRDTRPPLDLTNPKHADELATIARAIANGAEVEGFAPENVMAAIQKLDSMERRSPTQEAQLASLKSIQASLPEVEDVAEDDVPSSARRDDYSPDFTEDERENISIPVEDRPLGEPDPEDEGADAIDPAELARQEGKARTRASSPEQRRLPLDDEEEPPQPTARERARVIREKRDARRPVSQPENELGAGDPDAGADYSSEWWDYRQPYPEGREEEPEGREVVEPEADPVDTAAASPEPAERVNTPNQPRPPEPTVPPTPQEKEPPDASSGRVRQPEEPASSSTSEVADVLSRRKTAEGYQRSLKDEWPDGEKRQPSTPPSGVPGTRTPGPAPTGSYHTAGNTVGSTDPEAVLSKSSPIAEAYGKRRGAWSSFLTKTINATNDRADKIEKISKANAISEANKKMATHSSGEAPHSADRIAGVLGTLRDAKEGFQDGKRMRERKRAIANVKRWRV